MEFRNIRAEIARHGETQADIANLLGISEVCMNRRINGTTDFTINELLKLKEHWGVSIDYLVDSTTAA